MGISKDRQKEIDKYLNKSALKKYLKIYSANYIATTLFAPDFTTCATVVIKRAKKFNIPTHTVSTASKLKFTKNQKKQTNLKKYGVCNPSQADLIKKKKEKSAIEKYGCKNVFQAKEIKEKSKNTLYEKYGVFYTSHLPNYKPSTGSKSSLHKIISKELKNNKIFHKNEIVFKSYNNYYKRDFAPRADIVINKSKLIIEINGDFWHANPIKYKSTDLIPTWDGLLSAKEIWEKDKIKKDHLEKMGYKVYYVWESDIKNNYDKTIKDLLNEIEKNKIN